jgi:hypothetical protein
MLHARFGPVVALLLSLPALAQEPPGSETDELIDWRAIDKHLEGHRLEREALAARAERDAARDATRPRFAIDLEAVGGRAEQTSAASSLLTLRYRPVRTLSLGAVVPFAVGASPGPTGPTYGQTGAFSVFGALDPAYGPGTTFHLGLLVALPTVAGLAALPEGRSRSAPRASSPTRASSPARAPSKTTSSSSRARWRWCLASASRSASARWTRRWA